MKNDGVVTKNKIQNGQQDYELEYNAVNIDDEFNDKNLEESPLEFEHGSDEEEAKEKESLIVDNVGNGDV